MFEYILRKTEIALLETKLMSRIRMYLEIAQGESEVESELLRDPRLRKVYDQVPIKIDSVSRRPTYEAISLGNMEKLLHRDDEFAALVAKARQEYSNELSTVRRKLHANRLLLEAFISTVGTADEAVVFQDWLTALRRLSALSRPTVAPSPS
jgi:hypothetical protein